MKLERSHELWEEGKKYMPSGVSAGGRVNVACGMPHYIDHAEGARLYTVDDQEFIDYHGGSGAATSIRAFRRLLKNASKRAF